MFTAMGNIVPSHMMDKRLYDFMGLKATGVPDPEGDKAFDHEEEAPAQGVVQLQLDR
jgi:tRNA 2-thiocytidine biosynthesis protein TtcA